MDRSSWVLATCSLPHSQQSRTVRGRSQLKTAPLLPTAGNNVSSSQRTSMYPRSSPTVASTIESTSGSCPMALGGALGGVLGGALGGALGGVEENVYTQGTMASTASQRHWVDSVRHFCRKCQSRLSRTITNSEGNWRTKDRKVSRIESMVYEATIVCEMTRRGVLKPLSRSVTRKSKQRTPATSCSGSDSPWHCAHAQPSALGLQRLRGRLQPELCVPGIPRSARTGI